MVLYMKRGFLCEAVCLKLQKSILEYLHVQLMLYISYN